MMLLETQSAPVIFAQGLRRHSQRPRRTRRNTQKVMPKRPKKPALGFRNASVKEQLQTCATFARSLARMPEEQRRGVRLKDFQDALAEAELVTRLLETYRRKARDTLRRQKDVMARLRAEAQACNSGLMSTAIMGQTNPVESGLPLEKSKRNRSGAPGAPTELRAKVRAEAITLLWKNPMRRSIFNVEYALDSSNSGWRKGGSSYTVLKARFTFKPAVPGTLYWFRVQAWNSNGQSEWSAPLSVRAV
jgi:hypothetical protein